MVALGQLPRTSDKHRSDKSGSTVYHIFCRISG